jgi:parallel beta-helix repeat protein
MKQIMIRGFVVVLLCIGGVQMSYSDILFVTTTADTGTGSLRWAIDMAQIPGPDTICFAIPLGDPGYDASKGTWTIRPLSTLWAFTDGGTVIDGTSQTKFIGGDPNPHGPEIEIDGVNLTAGSVFVVLAPDVQIRGLTMNRAKYAAIMFNGVRGGGVFGCYLGTTSDGMDAAGNDYGVWILDHSRDIQIGRSEDPEEGNLISGNNIGIHVLDSCVNISIIGNRIGTNREGSDTIGNKYSCIGAYGFCDSLKIFDNLIGGSEIGIDLEECNYSHVANNFIGTDDSWTHNLGNAENGIYIVNANSSRIADNAIGNNKKNGIYMLGGICNLLTRNMISMNGHLGIELTNGANAELLPPTILSVTTTAVSGTAGPGNTVEVFIDDLFQGRYYRGTTIAGTDGAFVLSLDSPILRRYAIATATDSAGNTSGFSESFMANTVGVISEMSMPVGFELSQNYPNPFNPSTTIDFQIQKSGHVTLTVYNLLGSEVKTLVNEEMKPGCYKSIFDGSSLASGVYLYRFQANGFVQSKKFVLLK